MLVDTYAQKSEPISGPTPLSLSNLREEDKNNDKIQQDICTGESLKTKVSLNIPLEKKKILRNYQNWQNSER